MAPGLVAAEPGLGALSAAQILLSWSHAGRIHSEAAFGMLSGTAPVPVSSGRTDRHRLNLLGDRQLNRAIHVIAVNRMRCHPPTQAYVQRRRADGKTDKEIRGCIKRYLARHLYRTLSELLSMTSGHLVYKQIPSTVPGKYVYVTDHNDIRSIQHLLFSDQSHLGYIDEELNAGSLAELLLSNRVTYDRFADHQKPGIDLLLIRGVLVNDDSQIKLASTAQFLALRELWNNDAGNYWHHSPSGRAAIDTMVADGWLERRSTLLTTPEADYINYFLNQAGPTGGPDLRNRYLHGSQADGDDNVVHLHTYLIALRLLIALAIKINDDLCLRTDAEYVTCRA
jgi:Transposase IS116/IS110/IS902 family